MVADGDTQAPLIISSQHKLKASSRDSIRRRGLPEWETSKLPSI